jgi:hypothetical protein
MPAMSSPPRSQSTPRRVRWLVNTLAVATLGWMAYYCLYAWITHSGIWRIVWNAIASNQRATPSALSVAFISWGLGLAIVLLVGWQLRRLLRGDAARA